MSLLADTSFNQVLRRCCWLALLYVLMAQAGMLLAVPPVYATLFWPASGLALAAVLCWGYPVLAGVFVGSLVANAAVAIQFYQLPLDKALLVSAGVAIGATIQAAVSVWLLRRCSRPPWDLTDYRQALLLVLIGGPVGALISATAGNAVLVMAGALSRELFAHAWLTWWIGVSLGVFAAAPVLLLWFNGERSPAALRRKLLVTVPLLCLFLVVAAIFAAAKSNAFDNLKQVSEARTRAVEQHLLNQFRNYLRIQREIHTFFDVFGHVGDPETFTTLASGLLDNHPPILGLAYWAPTAAAGNRWRIAEREGAAPFSLNELRSSAVVRDFAGAAGGAAQVSLIPLAAATLQATTQAASAANDAPPYLLLQSFPGESTLLLSTIRIDGIFADLASTMKFVDFMISIRDGNSGVQHYRWPPALDESIWNDPQRARFLGLARHEVELYGSRIAVSVSNTQPFVDRVAGNNLWLLLNSAVTVMASLSFLIVTATGFQTAARRELNLRTSELQAERAFLDTLVENMPLVLYVKDAATREYLRFNKAAHELFKGPLEKFVGKTREQMFEGMIKSNLEADPDDAVALRGEIIDEESEFVLNGQSHWFRSKKVPIRNKDGEITFILGLAEDISKEKVAKQRREESQRHLSMILENVGEGIFGIDTDGNCSFVNRAACRALGYSEGEMLGKNCHELIHYKHKDGTPYLADKCPILAALEDRQAHQVGHEVFWQKSGNPIPIDYISTPIIREDEVLGAVVVFSDTSKRQAIDRLHKEHTQRLEQINQDLEEFSYVASHDIQEPLRTLNCFCEFLVEDIGGDLPESAETDIRYIIDASKRMSLLINDMLEYSRAGRTSLDMNEISPSLCIEHVRKDLLMLIRETGTQLVVHPLPLVMGDETQLTRVFQNLIHNAMKFRTEDTPARIEIEEVPSGDNDTVLIAVRDNGIGIEPQFHQQIFGAFKRLHSSEQYAGSGIGLAIVKKIIERHGGEIYVESELGKGTSFFIRLRKAIVYKPI